jgi:hypothetical protein
MHRKIALCLLAVVLVSGSGVWAQGSADPASVAKTFANPPKMYRPLVRWWWPGNDVENGELEREVDALDKAGFGGAEVQPFNIGLPKLPTDVEAKVNDYPTPSFFKHVATAVEAAKTHGLFIDYTFGSGWPFGGPEITPELASVELRWSHTTVYGPTKMHTRLELPGLYDGDPLSAAKVAEGLPAGWKERLEKRVKLVAVVAVRGEDTAYYNNQRVNGEQPVLKPGVLDQGSSIDLTAKMRPDGTLDWDVPPGTWQVFVYRSAPTLHKILGGVGNGPQLEMDHWSRAAFDAHAKVVGDNAVPYLGQYFGNGLRALFCDSLEVRENFYWSDDFLAEFKKRRGYDLTPYLPIVKVTGYGGPFNNFDNFPAYEMPGIGEQVRRDYWTTVSELMNERFFYPFNDWAHAHNLLARTQSHGAPADVLKIYGDADIPETEDLYDNGRYDFLKEASAAAHVYGRQIVGSESFVWRASLYQTTPEKMKRAGDELLTAGVNAILYHGFAYQLPGQEDPGWDPFHATSTTNSYSSQFNEKNPFWPFFRKFNDYLTRVQYISQTGKNVAQVAVYKYELQHGAKEPPVPTPLMQQKMMDAGYNYDDINEESLLASQVDHGMMVTKGDARYEVLVLPSEREISVALAEKLKGFAAEGLPMMFVGEVPSVDNSLSGDATNGTKQVQAAVRAMYAMKNVHESASANAGIVTLMKIVPADVRFRGTAYPYFEKKLGGLTAYFVRNAGDNPKQVTATFVALGTPELWDPWTGKSEAIRDVKRTKDGAELSFALAPVGSALIVFTPQATTSEVVPAVMSQVSETSVGDGGWKLHATGMTSGGKQVTYDRSLKALESWTFDTELKALAGHGTYTTTFTAPKLAAGQHLVLALGSVGDAAQVKVNGQDAGELLFEPYTVDVTSLVHEGSNELEVTVTNALFNAMVQRTPRPFGAGHTLTPSGLMPAGLIGPVELRVMQ